ncbi:MAG: hypothetical protein DRJ35_02095 [Thermoprotei archaeon]|nr:MAG: hypothetical protein DRJ35_02095 [Thermoprotei archaeon]
MTKALELNRREFLKLSGVVVAATALSQPVLRTLTPKEQVTKEIAQAETRFVPSICAMCPAACHITVRVKNGKVEKIEGTKGHPTNLGKICARGQAGVFRLYNPDRIKTPLIRDDPTKRGTWEGFRSASWDEALDVIAKHLKKLIDEGRAHEVGFIGGWLVCKYYKPFMKAFLKTIGSPNGVGIPAAACFFPKTVGWKSALGIGSHPEIITDYNNVKYLIVMKRNNVGSISVVHGTRVGRNLGNFKLVVVDPRFSETATKADIWVPIRAGTDLAFLLALINVVINEKLYDAEFLRKYTNAPMLLTEDGKPFKVTEESGKKKYLVWDLAQNKAVRHEEAILPALEGEFVVEGTKVKPVFQVLKEKVSGYTPEWAEKITGVSADLIRKIGIEFGKTRPAAVDTGWHDPKHINSVMTWRAAAILNALVGGLIKDGILMTGLGYLDTIKPSVPMASPKSVLRQWGEKNGVALAFTGFTFQGYYDAIVKGEPYPIKTVFLLSTNFLLTGAGAHKWREAFKKLEKVIAVDILPTDTASYADIILPESTYLEKDDPLFPITYAPAFGFQTRKKAIDPVYDTKHVIEIFIELAKRLGEEYYEKYFHSLAVVLGASDPDATAAKFKKMYEKEGIAGIRKVMAASKGVPIEELEKNGYYVKMPEDKLRKEALKLLEEGRLATPTGRIEIFSFMMFKITGNKGKNSLWDPIVDWAPPQVYGKADGTSTFYLVYGRIPTMTHTATADNGILMKLTPSYKFMVWINRNAAQRLGIKTGDKIKLTNVETGRSTEGIAFVTDLVREDTIWVASDFGQRSDNLRFVKGGVIYHFLTDIKADPVAGGVMAEEVIVRVEKA